METTAAAEKLSVSGRGLEALRSTRRWALLVAILMLIMVALAVVGNLVHAARGSVPPNVSPELRHVVRFMYIGFAVWTFIVNGIFVWFALQYARRLGASLRMGDPVALEEAFWWQRRFWTLQGVLVIVLVALYIVAIIAAVAFAILHLP